MLADLLVLALVLVLCVLVAILVSWAAPHWVEHLPTTTTTTAAAATWPSNGRSQVLRYGDSPETAERILAALGAHGHGAGLHGGRMAAAGP